MAKTKMDVSEALAIAAVNMTKARKDAKISRAKLSKLAGISHTTLEQWEKGKFMPSAILADRVAAELGITLDEYINGKIGG